MTEPEWLAATHPDPLLAFLNGTASERKLRLFACSCCRRIEHLLSFPKFIQVVEVAEEFADGNVSDEERQRAHKAVSDYNWSHSPEHTRFRFSDWAVAEAADSWPTHICHPIEKARQTADSARKAMERDDTYRARLAAGPPEPEPQCHTKEVFQEYLRGLRIRSDFVDGERQRLDADEEARQASFLRDIFDKPFRTVAVDPAWRTSDVLLLAEGIYAERAFDRMPILADALQDAGCDCADVLDHCRDPNGPHVRGCWVVDLVLGKE